MAGTVAGAAIMGVLRNSLVVLRFNIFYQDVVLGLAVLLAVVIHQIRRGGFKLKYVRSIAGKTGYDRKGGDAQRGSSCVTWVSGRKTLFRCRE